MVDECLARVEHAAGTKRAGGELVAHGRRVARGGQRGASVLDGASEWGAGVHSPAKNVEEWGAGEGSAVVEQRVVLTGWLGHRRLAVS
jgi:hypothetical protein